MSRGRPALEIGTAGAYNFKINAKGQHIASCGFRYMDGSKGQISRSGKTKAAANRALNAAVEEAKEEAQGHGGKITRTSTVKELMEYWFEEHTSVKNLSGSTTARYKDYINRLVVKPFGQLKLNELTVGMLDKYQKELYEGSVSRPKCFRTVFKPALALAFRHRAISANLLDFVSPLRAKVKTPVRDATDDEVELILRELPKYRRGPGVYGPAQSNLLEDGILTLLGTGMRIGEMLGLRRSDLSLDASPPTISVRGTLITGEGGIERKPTPKTPSSNRTIPVPPFVVLAIKRQLSEDPCEDLEQTVFRSREGGLMSDNNFRRSFRNFLKSIGLGGLGITPHTFRATYATRLERSLGLQVASKSLGHSSINTTIKSYIAQPDIVNPQVLQGVKTMFSLSTQQALARVTNSDDFFEI